MKFLFISPRFSGGIGGHAAMLADKLTQNGHHVKKLETTHLPIKNLKNPSFAIFSSFKSIVDRGSYDIVHGFNIPSAYAMKYAKAKKKVLSLHGVFSEHIEILHSKLISSVAKNAESQVLTWPDKLTTDSKSTQSLYKQKFNINFEYLPSPLDTEKFSTIPNVEKNPMQIAYVGRASYEKGFDIMKEAEDKINGDVVYCTDKSWKEAMITMKSSSVVVVPSRMDSFPTTVKEAFFLNVPVVGTDAGGIPELIKHNESGIIVPKENSEQLALAVNDILKNPDKAMKFAQKGNEFVNKHLTWDVMLPKYVDFYQKLLDN